MKALSLWQPWASAVAVEAKRIETRHWSTSYRGPIAVHAAKRFRLGELISYNSCWNWQGALRPLGIGWGSDKLSLADPGVLPLGAIIAVADLVDCRPTESFTVGELDTVRYPEGDTAHLYGWTERQMGDFSPGRFGWIFEDIKRLEKPVPCIGRQSLFETSL